MSSNGNGSENAPAAGKRAYTGLYVRSKTGVKLRDETTRRLVRKMRVAMPWLEDSDLPVCRSWAELEVLGSRVYAELRNRGVIGAEGDARRLLNDYRTLRATQLAFARELGMTPAARMALKTSGTRAAFDLAAAMAQDPEDAE